MHPAIRNFIDNIVHCDTMYSIDKSNYLVILNKLITEELARYNARLINDQIEFANKDDMTEFLLRWS